MDKVIENTLNKEKDTEGKAAAEKSSEEKSLSPKKMMEKFDEILGSHIEKLLGTKTGIESLSMNLLNLSYIILVAARETEIESFPYLPPERYTDDKIFDELTDISIDPGDNLELVTLDMVEKGYIEVADDGRFFAQKPAITIARLIDQIFPNMPGLNLVAYWGQMMDEVNVGRKTPELALSQFDQMLGMQGVLPKKQAKKTKPARAIKSPALKQETRSHKSSSVKPANIFSQLKTALKADTPNKIDEGTGQKFNEPVELTPEEIKAETYSQDSEDIETDSSDIENELREDPVQEESCTEAEAPEDEPVDQPDEDQDETDGNQGTEPEEEDTRENIATEPEKKESGKIVDDEVEKQITAFEQELGMKCPLCQTGDIMAEETAKGKKYFRCSNNKCNLISWGKPFYLTCPQCKNPFLIEASRGENTVLKCPRATCHHWQKFPWEIDAPDKQASVTESSGGAKKKSRRKKRRRRVIRRKRT